MVCLLLHSLQIYSFLVQLHTFLLSLPHLQLLLHLILDTLLLPDIIPPATVTAPLPAAASRLPVCVCVACLCPTGAVVLGDIWSSTVYDTSLPLLLHHFSASPFTAVTTPLFTYPSTSSNCYSTLSPCCRCVIGANTVWQWRSSSSEEEVKAHWSDGQRQEHCEVQSGSDLRYVSMTTAGIWRNVNTPGLCPQ